MEIIDSEGIFHAEFNVVFHFFKLAPVFSQSLRLVAAACGDGNELEGNEAQRYDARRDKPPQLNVQIARKREPISKNGKQR